jgi:hypothetical protein
VRNGSFGRSGKNSFPDRVLVQEEEPPCALIDHCYQRPVAAILLVEVTSFDQPSAQHAVVIRGHLPILDHRNIRQPRRRSMVDGEVFPPPAPIRNRHGRVSAHSPHSRDLREPARQFVKKPRRFPGF